MGIAWWRRISRQIRGWDTMRRRGVRVRLGAGVGRGGRGGLGLDWSFGNTGLGGGEWGRRGVGRVGEGVSCISRAAHHEGVVFVVTR